MGDGIDENSRDVTGPLITQNAYGMVLDIGAGHGHTANYLDINRVTKYVALEPNTHMHEEIRKIANKAGNLIRTRGPLSVDTVVCVLSLCTVPSPEETINRISNELLNPGGVFLLYEHVLSPCADVAWWQWFWSPIWSKAFDGCRLDRPTYVWVRKATNWEVDKVWTQEGEPEEHLFWHQIGKFVKATQVILLGEFCIDFFNNYECTIIPGIIAINDFQLYS
ncbi:hypothetical protein CERSUDRAFT_115820 [Gelatoporia subvermispora B]|uniref:Methyltransferase type 11 domain-containing protein n=1 Tax=Ceriporiopsis subvermispora (strain B) TaxID=914234 RepID=M2RBZ8_CERS8|nr:hypothetical protein CERSUDRAFT_115820 [Gelatoporia subvermispora B]